MGLLQVATNTVTSGTAYVDLIGTTTDDVYMISIVGMTIDTDDRKPALRVLASSSPKTTNYKGAHKNLYSNSAIDDGYFQTASGTGNQMYISTNNGTGTGEALNAIIYLFNFNNSSSGSYITYEMSVFDKDARLAGRQGGGINTTEEAHNGIRVFLDGTGNIDGGTFTLYKVI